MSISCIIPTHAREELLAQSLASVLSQTLKPQEIIVVDNVPSVETRQLVHALASQSDILIRYAINDTGLGPSVSRNVGAALASGQFLAFLDDDDRWKPEYLARASALFGKRTSAVLSWMNNFDQEKTWPGKNPPNGLHAERFLLVNPGITGSNLVIAADVYRGLGGFDQQVLPSDDKDFMIRFLRAGFTYSVLTEALAEHRVHTSLSMSASKLITGRKVFYAKHHEWMPWPYKLAFQGTLYLLTKNYYLTRVEQLSKLADRLFGKFVPPKHLPNPLHGKTVAQEKKP